MNKLVFAGLLAFLSGCGGANVQPAAPPAPAAPAGAWKTAPGLFAVLNTDKGQIVCKLYDDKTPKTVSNFTALAGKKYYDGSKFFRVIPGFMIQGGDPTNVGNGGPGYQFDDEIVAGLTFDRAYLLAMANAGLKPDGHGTNGSQFFITDRTRNGIGLPTHLNGHHTIFGEVVEGMDVVGAIADVPTEGDRALSPATVLSLEIVRNK